MKQKTKLLGFVATLVMVVATLLFSLWKNDQRNAMEINISFNKTPLFLNDSTVNKLLTQIALSPEIKSKDSLDLNMLELVLQDIPVIQNAEVYQYPKGELGVELYERKPLFRVLGEANYYVDRFGVKFPLSKIHVSDVPVFLGVLSDEIKPSAIALIEALQEDNFLKEELVHLSEENGVFRIGIRSVPYDFIFGKPVRVKSKINKLKVFCAYQKEQNTSKEYQSANLIYKDQVVVTSL